MTINTAPASRELTLFSRVINRDGERAQIRRAKAVYFRNGGLIGVYAPGAAWDAPAAAKQVIRSHGRDKTVHADVTEYLAPLKAHMEAKRARARRLHDERLARAASLSA